MTTTTNTRTSGYLLGHDDAELRRLEEQARILAPATGAILTLAGVRPGMRVLDLGSGAGDVAFLLAGRVGPDGSVVGVDSAAAALEVARRRADRQRVGNVSFVEGDVRALDAGSGLGTFDAVVGRLILLYVDDPADVVRRLAGMVRPDGVLVAMEYDIPAAGSVPARPLSDRVVAWVSEAFRRTGHDPHLGPRLVDILTSAGLDAVVSIGMQSYLTPDDPMSARLPTDIVRTLLPAVVGTGIATAEEVDIDTLEKRIADDQRSVDALLKPPTLVGAWGRRAGARG